MIRREHLGLRRIGLIAFGLITFGLITFGLITFGTNDCTIGLGEGGLSFLVFGIYYYVI
jgi:hypothetical protein